MSLPVWLPPLRCGGTLARIPQVRCATRARTSAGSRWSSAQAASFGTAQNPSPVPLSKRQSLTPPVGGVLLSVPSHWLTSGTCWRRPV